MTTIENESDYTLHLCKIGEQHQIVIPDEVRKEITVKKGDTLALVVKSNGFMVLCPPTPEGISQAYDMLTNTGDGK